MKEISLKILTFFIFRRLTVIYFLFRVVCSILFVLIVVGTTCDLMSIWEKKNNNCSSYQGSFPCCNNYSCSITNGLKKDDVKIKLDGTTLSTISNNINGSVISNGINGNAIVNNGTANGNIMNGTVVSNGINGNAILSNGTANGNIMNGNAVGNGEYVSS